MQETRERIVHILKTRGQATVDQLSRELGLTSVTVRHHLRILHNDGLVAPPLILRRSGPGRPQHLYRLTGEASALFPKRYDVLAREALEELARNLSPAEVRRAAERIARRIAAQAQIPEDADLPSRLEAAVDFLNDWGYLASVEVGGGGGFLLHIYNCPYERVARDRPEPCEIDLHLIPLLVGARPQRIEQIAQGDGRCTYVFPAEEA